MEIDTVPGISTADTGVLLDFRDDISLKVVASVQSVVPTYRPLSICWNNNYYKKRKEKEVIGLHSKEHYGRIKK